MKDQQFIKLLTDLQAKQLDALETIYREYFLRFQTTAFYIVHNRQDAYDIAMNVIAKLIAFDGAPEKIVHHKSWLNTIVRNESLDFLRKRKRIVSDEDEITMQGRPMQDDLWLTDIYALLTEEEQEIFTEKFVWDKKLKKIAAEKGLPYIRIKRTHLEIKRKIKIFYNEQGGKR